MSTSSLPASETLSYEAARDELIDVVNRLERGGTSLEESLQLWERGEKLAARCEEWLLGARQRLEAARQGAAQQVSAAGDDPGGKSERAAEGGSSAGAPE